VTFQAPLLLALLGLVPLLAAAYVLAQRRRRRFAVRYTNVDVLAGVAGGRAWARHLPALLALLALAALLVALARPQHTVAAERHEATVLLVTDTSGSMTATDVKPTRLAAAQAAARTFARKIPDEFRLGLISFGSVAQEVSDPTTDHARVIAAINSLQVQGGTAMGDALNLAVNAARVPVPDGLGGSRRLPAAIVMLSDGASTRGADPITVVQQN
jgi:Ca-activated chloride channel family protein